MAAPNNNMPLPVATFVFIDLEATGLNGIGEKPRITELCLVATHRVSLLEKSFQNTPRVLNKLTLCLDPCKAIGYGASVLTGLYNDALSLHGPFSESVVDLCTLFFQQLTPPICLLAHNGHKYDFPLLAAELLRVGRHFPANILCVDTLDGFREVLSIEAVQRSILSIRSMHVLHDKPAVTNGARSEDDSPLRSRRPVVRRLVMNDTDNAPLPNTTPEMQMVKANDKITNAPMKKPIHKETTKTVRLSSAKRKLEFGGMSVSGLTQDAVDDVDREDVLDEIHGFHLASTVAQAEKEVIDREAKEFALDEMPSNLCEDDVPDNVLVCAVDEFEQSFEAGATRSIPSNDCKVPSVKSWANVVQSTCNKPKETPSSPKPSCSKDDDPQPISPAAGPPSSPNPNKLASGTKQQTPPSTALPLVSSYLTPPPSRHKNGAAFSSNLSPLATPFVPQSLRSTPLSAYKQGSSPGSPLGISMALGSLHKRLLGYEPSGSHRAEDDCMALMRISNRLTPWFCNWVDKNAALFNMTSPMYKATKRPKKP